MSTPDYTAAIQILASATSLSEPQIASLNLALGIGSSPVKQAAIDNANPDKTAADAALAAAQAADVIDQAAVAKAQQDQAAAVQALADANALPD